MSDPLVIHHDEFALSIGLGDDGPVPPDLFAELLPHVTYVHRESVSRFERRDPQTGDIRKFKSVPHDLYQIEQGGRLVLQTGYLQRVVDTGKGLGHEVLVRDLKFQGYPDCRPEVFTQDWDNFVRNFEPRHDRQLEMIVTMADSIYGRVDAATGVGKTFCAAAEALVYPNAEFVLTVPNKGGMLDTAYKHACTVLPAADVGRIGGGHNRKERFTIVVVDSLVNKAMSLRPDELIVDECHTCLTDRRATAITQAGRRARIKGLSASMCRLHSNADFRSEGLFGGLIFSLSMKEAVSLDMAVPIQVRWNDVILRENPCAGMSCDTARKRNGIWRNAGRNSKVCEVAARYGPEVRTLISTEVVEHALLLAKALPAYHVIAGGVSDKLAARHMADDNGVSPDRVHTTPRQQHDVLKRFAAGDPAVTKLISTGVLGAGFSVDSLGVLIRAEALKSDIKAIQWPGRVCRKDDASGKGYGVVEDFVDQFDTNFRSGAWQRRRMYASLGFKQFREDGKEIVPRAG